MFKSVKNNRIFILVSFFCLLLGMPCPAKNIKNYKFHTLSPEGGFYYDGVKSIQQDSDGYIWIVMENDLYRFDGYQYKRYYSYFRSLDTSDKWYFRTVELDDAGRLFVATNKGLFVYDKITDSFKLLFKPNIVNVKTDSRKNLWLISASVGMFDVEKRTFFGMEAEGGLIQNATTLCNDENELITGTKNGEIYRFDYDKMQFKQLFTLPDNQGIIEIKKNKDHLWVLTESYGLYKIDGKTLAITNHYRFFCILNNEYVPAKTLYIDKNDNVWVGTQRGLYIMDPVTEEYTHFTNSRSDAFSLPSNSIWTIKEDAQKNVWIGTYSGGLCYLNFRETSRFHTFTQQEKGLNHKVVSGFAEDTDYLWIATEGGGLNRMNKKTGEFACFNHNPKINSLTYDNVKSLAIDPSGNLWIAMYRGGLDCLSKKTGTFRKFNSDSRGDNQMLINDLRKIMMEGDSGLWITYQHPGITFYSFATDQFSHYMTGSSHNSSVSDICRGQGDALWVINNEELYYMNIGDKSYKKRMPDVSSSFRAQTLCMDKSGILWLGTVGSGLIKYDPEHDTFEAITDILRYDVSTIYGICTDDDDDIWMGTDNGLFKYSPQSRTLFRFDKKDGIQGLVFYPKACLKGKNGELYFGGTNGFTIINPKDVLQNEFKPRAIITDFYIDNTLVKPDSTGSPLHKSISATKEIVLDYNQINFGFKVSSDNYLIPEKTRFKYRLLGYDDRWIEIDATNRIVSYAKVPAGSYTFEVIASNNDGIWNQTPTILTIRRQPVPWLSGWAYAIYLCLFFSVAGAIFYYYFHQKKLKLELFLETMEMQRQEENHQAQLRFFTNISHDFRTPLSLIMAAIEQMQQNYGNSHYIRLLNSNARRLLNLVNELMDFRTVENGKMKLKITDSDINRFVREIASDFQEYALQKEIDFTIVCDPSISSPICFDEQIMEKIILNLLNNAFKYTHNGGRISIETRLDTVPFHSDFKNSYATEASPELKDTFSIRVKDTGVGISAESIAHVFERFYKVDSNDTEAHIGSGIGLALVKSLVLLHKGTISVFSERSEGTEMLIRFPLYKSMYEASDFKENAHAEQSKTRSYSVEQEQILHLESEANKPETFLLREKKRILLVEDNEDLRGLIAEHLRTVFDISEAGNGEEALKIAEELVVDLIVSDIMMPVMNGITLCKAIKENINSSHIPFVMLTARGGLENQMEGLDSGADAYFEKPIDFNLLKQTIRNIFHQQEKLKDYYARNYFVDSRELAANQQDNKFITRLIEIIESRIDQSDMDVNYIASELSMSRSKLYSKVKSLTDKSIVEFIRSYRLRKAATLLIEENLSIRETMERIGIESQSYFTRIFKAEFGMIPSVFIQQNSKSSHRGSDM